MMEPMDGWETLMHIKNTAGLKVIPVMMLTAKQLTPSEAQEYGIYIEDYIMKPITHRELYDAIEGLLNRRRVIEMDMKMAEDAGVEKRRSTSTPGSEKISTSARDCSNCLRIPIRSMMTSSRSATRSALQSRAWP